MLERYKRTFLVTQGVIAAVSTAVLVQSQRWQTAAVFFAVMQIGSLTGSLWAARLKRKIERGQGLLALH